MENDTLSDLNLKVEFPIHTYEDWVNAVKETLKGADFDKVMRTKTYEGITLSPIYRKEDIDSLNHLDSLPGNSPFVRGNTPTGFTQNGWHVAQKQDNPVLEQLNKELISELNRGLTMLNFDIHPCTIDGRIPQDNDLNLRGVSFSCMQDIECLLNGIDIEIAPVFLNSKSASLAILGLLNAYVKHQDYVLKNIEAVVGFDPLSELASNGFLPYDLDVMWQMMYQMTFWADMKAPKIRTICIDASSYASCGASSVQELAFAISTAIGYIKGLLDKGLSIEQIAPHFQINLSLGSNFFMEIAKVRSARMLWAEIIKAFGGSEEAQKVWIHGQTSEFNKSLYDPYVNVLRTTTEAFSAIIGGIDSLDVGTFNELSADRDQFSKRIARNQQVILREEAHFDRVIDPAGGCYYIESLTSEIAHQAWAIMQGIESEGGFYKSLLAGTIQKMINGTCSQRIENVNKRRDVFVGVNMFANPDEQLSQDSNTTQDWVLDARQRLSGSGFHSNGKKESLEYLKENINNEFLVDMVTDAWLHGANIEEVSEALGINKNSNILVSPIVSRRAVEDIESLRNTIHRFSEEHGKQSIFMVNIGSLASIKPRIDFSIGFLQVAGFDVINSGTFTDVDSAVKALETFDVKAVCVCSGDDQYPVIIPELCDRITDLPIIVAGYPQDMVDSYRKAGVKSFIHLRANAYETLAEIATLMGVRS